MKNVVITGATRGLGLAIVSRLLMEDYRLICVGRKPSPEFTTLCDQAPDKIAFRPYDLSDLDGIQALVNGVTREFGPLYGLVNNAGVGLDGLLATQHASDISRVLRVNLEAAILLTKYEIGRAHV